MSDSLPSYTGVETYRDIDISPYYRSELRRLSPEETWAAINARLLGLLRGLHAQALIRPIAIDPGQLDRWHGYLFGQDFHGAGRARRGNVAYPVQAEDGGPERLQRGTDPDRVRQELGVVCRAFQAHLRDVAAAGAELDATAGARAAAELYAGILRVHPYDDGNGRLAFVALQAALLSQGMHAIVFDDLRGHDLALGPALRHADRDLAPLARLVAAREADAAARALERVG